MGELKYRKKILITIDLKIHEQLKTFSEETGAPISRLIEIALKEKYKI